MLSVKAYISDRCYTYTFDNDFELTEWMDFEGGDYDRIVLEDAEV